MSSAPPAKCFAGAMRSGCQPSRSSRTHSPQKRAVSSVQPPAASSSSAMRAGVSARRRLGPAVDALDREAGRALARPVVEVLADADVARVRMQRQEVARVAGGPLGGEQDLEARVGREHEVVRGERGVVLRLRRAACSLPSPRSGSRARSRAGRGCGTTASGRMHAHRYWLSAFSAPHFAWLSGLRTKRGRSGSASAPACAMPETTRPSR